MRKLRAACLPLVGGLLCSLWTPLVSADAKGAASPRRGQPTARALQTTPATPGTVGAVPVTPPAPAAKGAGPSPAKAKKGGKKRTRKTTSRRGRRPKPKPRTRGSKPGLPDAEVRKSLTGRYPNHSTAAPAESPELKAMLELDHELFPPVPAPPQAPWATSLRLPKAGPKVDASGLPPTAPSANQAKETPSADLAWIAKLKKPDFPVRFEPSVVRYLKYYKDTKRGRARVARWVQKSGRYRKAITKLLRQYQMPED
ncbi:MAG: hypothetical protein JRI68_23100, partial [Deltaproteobacteria bacterium]|nr:hypothetical protein [Deltaproteobacteria bacterium]